jgi:hypothetical protein
VAGPPAVGWRQGLKAIPPATATWLLKHLVLGRRNEALEGDLLEEFQRRRSADWYWRQAIGAVLGFSNLLRAAWVTASAVVFAAVWIYGNCATACLINHLSLQRVSGYWIPYGGRPIRIVVGISFYLAAALLLYLAFTRNLSLRSLAVGLGAGSAVAVIMAVPCLCSFFQTHLNPLVNYFLAYAHANHWNMKLWVRLYETWQGSLPLLVAMWAAALNKTKMGPLNS